MNLAEFMVQVVPERQADTVALAAVFGEVTGFAPDIWPGKIIGFGRYEYRYDSGRTGVSLATGFAPRKAELVLYGLGLDEKLLAALGRHRRGKGCIYVRQLEHVQTDVLRCLIASGLQDLARQWTIRPA